ncbi:MAG: hypothetical protein LBK62_13240 [Treponema sp.]|jgi:chromosome segregation ATPase|nr:hypothetical protein [Treponema sp.]
MDDRKRQIEELERHKRESVTALDSLLERFGESLLSRAGQQIPAEGADACAAPASSFTEESSSFTEEAEYHRLRKEIADSEAAIAGVEIQIRQLKDLDEKIAQKERESDEQAKDLAGVYGRLGKALFSDGSGAYGEYTEPFRDQVESLCTKVRSLEERVAGLEQKEGNNVFAWIGKNAQSLVLRSFLTKAQDNLEQLYRAAGERYGRQDTFPADSGVLPEIAGLTAETAQVKEQARSLSKKLSEYREERRGISEGFDAEGSPAKRIHTLKNHIAGMREELRLLYRRFGADAASLGGREGGAASLFDTLFTADDQAFLDEAARISQAIHDAESATAKLRASLAIDEEQAKIDNCRKFIADKRSRIAEAEKDIAGFEDSIQESEKCIEALQKLV